MHTVLELLKLSQDYLARQGIEQPRLEAELLLGHVLNKKRLDLYLEYTQPVTERDFDRLNGSLKTTQNLTLQLGARPNWFKNFL